MTQTFKADRGSAITLTAILTKFKNGNNFTIDSLSKICKEEGIGTHRQIREIIQCLKDMGYISNHGRKGNRHHFNMEFRTSHLMSELYKRGVISWMYNFSGM